MSASVTQLPIYRAGTIMRERRINARIEQLDEQILAVLREDNPQSVRHVFYRMTDPRLPEPVEKTERGYRRGTNPICVARYGVARLFMSA